MTSSPRVWTATLTLLVTAAAALALVACGGGDGGGGGDEAAVDAIQWAASVCDVVGDFVDGVSQVSARFPSDPRSLPLAERKAQGVAQADALSKASDTAASLLDKLKAPKDALKYHSTIIGQFREISRVLKEMRTNVQAATTAQQLDALGVRFDEVLDETDAAEREAYEELPEDARSALENVPGCEIEG